MDRETVIVPENGIENNKHVSSSKTSKANTGSAKRKDKKTSMVRHKNIGIDYIENQPIPNPGGIPNPSPILPLGPPIPGTFPQGLKGQGTAPTGPQGQGSVPPGSQGQGTVPPGPQGQGTVPPGEQTVLMAG